MSHQDGSTQPQNAGPSSATISSQNVGTAPTDITSSCEEVVVAYRAGNLTRSVAVDRLGSSIAAAPGGIGGNPGALQAHLASLDEWDRERVVAAARGIGEASGRPFRIDEDEGDRHPIPARQPGHGEGEDAGPNPVAAASGIFTPHRRGTNPS